MIPQTVAHQPPLSMEFSRQEYWSIAIPFSRGSSNPGIELGSPALQADSFPSEPPGKSIIKQESTIRYPQETHFRAKDTCRLKMKEWKKIFHANENDKKVGVAILISDKIVFKTEAIK